MQVTKIIHSTLLIEDRGVKVLCDPWLDGEAFYGSWAHYPPTEHVPSDFNDVDFIYISHIHPDHLHHPTLDQMDKDIPVLIHDFKWDFVRKNIEHLGFDVTELKHGERHHLKNDLHLGIYAADDCDPQICQNLFGCSWFVDDDTDQTEGSTHIDTMGVFDNGDETLVNVNDSRWPLSQRAAQRVKQNYGDIDCLLTQMASAGMYPHSMNNLSHEKMIEERDNVIEEAIETGLGFVRELSPDVVIPFAAGVVFAGKRAERTKYHPMPPLVDARDYYHNEAEGVDPSQSEMFLLNEDESFDVSARQPSAEYEPLDQDKKWEYIRNELKDRKYTYESEEMPTLEELDSLLADAFVNFTDKRKAMGFETDTVVYVDLLDDTALKLPFDGRKYELVPGSEVGSNPARSVNMTMDPRLFKWILEGPHKAHFNNAQGGCHFLLEKDPDTYERGIYYCLSFLHQ
ncbi:MAG: MBL fold metallo-hydrolase [bacterium]